MNAVLNKFLILIVTFLMGMGNVFAVPQPPSPRARTMEEVSPHTPVGPGMSIDTNLLSLLVIAVLFGIYVIYKREIRAKLPI